MLWLVSLLLWNSLTAYSVEVDTKGYILYCPCMGRFGNQADQFLGALSFAKGLDRTLVLPHWITYPSDMPFKSLQIDFNKWFKVKPLERYHRVMLMNDFMENLSDKVWPVGQRKGFCYSFRDNQNKCEMKVGNPFGPFWDYFNINFDSYIAHQGLLWDSLGDESTQIGWLERFPSSKFPVIAFQGAPGSFPSLKSSQKLQQYIEFSDEINEMADAYIQDAMNGETFVGIHLRNGRDMLGMCEDLHQYGGEVFSSAQCTGFGRVREPLTKEMCNPSKENVLSEIRNHVKRIDAKALYIATDNNPMIEIFKENLHDLQIAFHTRRVDLLNDVDDPIVDLALLTKADHFIGNCLSTFSAFVRRHRETHHLPFSFFGLGKSAERLEL